MSTMSKITLRSGSCGFALACLLFAASYRWGGGANYARIEAIFWPTMLLLSGRASPEHALSVGTIVLVGFSALMNGALYFGFAWVLWWAGRLAGLVKTAPSEIERMVSGFLALGLGFALIVALAELALRGLPASRGPDDVWLIFANLFALITITCATAGWSMWWLRKYFRGRVHGAHSGVGRGRRKS